MLLDKPITAMFICIFAIIWFFSTKYYEKPKQYSIVVYDLLGNESTIEGLRTNFKTNEVATSFIREYQKRFPHYSFSLSAHIPEFKRKTVFNTILKK